MCGIAGLLLRPDAPVPDDATLAALQRALAHRGPDGGGRHDARDAVLIHTRLAIIDLATGDQPLFTGAAALVGNGEIYNYRELRAAMPCTPFATNSDNEPPLHLWRREGAAFTRHLRGMYAIAIHGGETPNGETPDAETPKGKTLGGETGTLTLARDPFGIKPLYIAETRFGLAFASEPQAFLASGLVARGLRPAARDELLQRQFTSGAETIFPGIHRVLPGEVLTCAEGSVARRTRTTALPGGGCETIGADAALARLDAALMQSVDLHQRSDVPYGMFLSGGIDSAAILTVMARLNDRPVLAFTAGFDVQGAPDEREAAAAVAKGAGARHETLTVTEAMVWRHLPEIVACMDDPAADFAIIPTWFLARRARAEVKVVLSGEGGDEMFAGYGRYRAAMRPYWRRLWGGGRATQRRGVFDRVDVLRSRPAPPPAAFVTPGRSRLAAAQEADMADWLPHDLLIKLDRCLMAHAVEGRTPFLDPAVAAAAFLLPDPLKVRHGLGKWLLRQWLARHCPAARPFARKQGFTVPVGAWIANAAERLGPLVASEPGIAEIAAPDRVRALFRAAAGRREGAAAWSLLFYALWHRAHVLGLPLCGDVFETLAAR